MTAHNVELIADIEDLSYEQLRIEFMRMSPTYQFLNYWYGDVDQEMKDLYDGWDLESSYLRSLDEAMHLHIRRGINYAGSAKLTYGQRKRLLNTYEDAYKSFEEYDDINKPYELWLHERGQYIFDTPANAPLISDHGTVDTNYVNKNIPSITASLKKLENSLSSRLHIVLSVPMYMTHKDAVTQISAFLKGNLFAMKKQPRVRKQLHGKRHRIEPLIKKLKLMMYKCMYPDDSLLELGLRANISPSNEIIIQNKSGLFKEADIAAAKRRIGLATSRALTTAEYIAERAARDQFPDPRTVMTPIFDWAKNKEYLFMAWPNLKG